VDHNRFVLLAPGGSRPGRVAMPPAFAVKASSADTAGRLSVLEVTLARDIPRHTHHGADECVYVLDGRLEVEFDDRTLIAEPGARPDCRG
jgi:quercetin dioxygenase-like cupin family protein